MMFRASFLRATLAALCLVLTQPAPVSAEPAACKLRLAATDMPPYQVIRADGTASGIDIDLMTEAAQRMPCAIEWITVPRTRAMVLVQEGKVDGVPGVARTAEREAFGLFSQPMRQGRNALIVRKNTSADYPLESLTALAASKFRLGATAGTKYSQEFEDLLKGGALVDNLVIVQNGESAMNMLLRGRIDGFLDGYRIAMSRANQMGQADAVEAHPMHISEHQAYVIFSIAANVDPAVITRFNAVLLGMQMDGTVGRIVDAGKNS